ncbi:hypothetical protein K469DRAFT_732524 [Zopfia rhizophila CBS 207.26]|uniref:CFEM domain-containing protein n=1 Tax=Zopfia rhizophila CBS 207.26 TaxID=1314779 RepID=A0A6A6EJ94_9PEZI|nr:hypothetical protein K469DRAFT_732524 [Zopfia rhizophila CBS 207.26]
MKFTATVFAFAASLALVGAQDLTGIPPCAISCFAAALPASGCSATDTKCQCTTGKDAITKSVATCIPSKCSADDQSKVLPAAEAICAKAGITVSGDNTASATAGASATGVASNVTATASGVRSATGTASAQQTTNAAIANVAGLGAVAFGIAAVLGL